MAKLNLDVQSVISQINELIDKINSIKSSTSRMSQASKANFTSLSVNARNLKTSVAGLGNQINYLKSILKQQTSAQKSATKTTKAATNAVKANAAATKKGAKATKKFTASWKDLLKGGAMLKAIQMLKDLAVNVYSNIKTFDSLGFTLEKITKTAFAYENSQRFLLRITRAYGVELVTTTLRWSRFLAAAQNSGLALRDTENIFESMTKASAALGLKTDELSSVYLALEQMLSKGKVTTEELRRQLGERLPGAMGIMAASMGVTIPVLDKMLKRGEVLSAEVLPAFAEAVERAYGIENADRIETLVAKQNRLTAAWQTFIKNISEGDSVIKRVFGGILDNMTEILNGWEIMFSTVEQKMRRTIGDAEEALKIKLEYEAGIETDNESPIAERDHVLEARLKDNLEQLKTAKGDEREFILNDTDEINRIRELKSQASIQKLKDIAKAGITESYTDYIAATEAYEEIDKAREQDILDREENIRRKKLKLHMFEDEPTERKPLIELTYNPKDYDEAQKNLIDMTAKYNLYLKLIEESNVSVVPGADEVGKVQRRLREIKDYYLETVNEISKAALNGSKDRAADEELNVAERLKAMKESARLEIFIRKNALEIQERDYNIKFNKEVDSIKKSISTGNLARAKGNKHIEDLETEKYKFIRLKNQELVTDLLAMNKKFADESADLSTSDSADKIQSAVTNTFTKRLLAAQEEFEQSNKNSKARNKLEHATAQIAVDSANAIIDVKVKLLEEEIAILEASGDSNSEYVTRIRQEIDELNAGRKIDPLIDEGDWAKVFEEALDVAAEFTGAIGDLVDATFDRKIEYINAEIQAESDKYDKLISLAEGDDEQQATLERNKEDRIQKLERERLKQEQKQAKAKKKFAVADIAISTARAIVGIWADFPKGDYGIAAGIMTGVVAALGAAQIATVIAQPIPQYKDGVENLSKDEVAMINDGGFKEYIERNGRILSTNKPNAIVDLQKGDTVYKNKADMVRNSELFRLRNMNVLQMASTKKIGDDIKMGIKDGFKKVRIDNKVSVNSLRDESYRLAKSRWN